MYQIHPMHPTLSDLVVQATVHDRRSNHALVELEVQERVCRTAAGRIHSRFRLTNVMPALALKQALSVLGVHQAQV